MRDDQMPAATRDILQNALALEPKIRQSSQAIEAERRLPPALARELMEA